MRFTYVISCIVLVAISSELARAATAPPLVSSIAAPRVVVWDPQQATAGSRFTVDPAAFDAIADEMRSGGVEVTRLTASQIADDRTFPEARFDAVVLLGGVLPRADLTALESFANGGGVVIDLAAEVPFLICIEQQKDGQWQLSPPQPRFAWQTSDLLKQFGLRDDYQQAALEGQGVLHTATPLFKKYLPQAIDLHGRLPSKWIVPGPASKDENGEIYPLIRSQRLDNAEVPPQLYVVRHGASTAIISCSDLFTSDVSKDAWPFPAQTAVAIAHLAHDLHVKALDLSPEMAINIPAKLKPEQPGTLDRLAYGHADPEHATPVVRWGQFDGSCEEFGPALEAGQTAEVPANAAPTQFPRSLAPGATARLQLPRLSSNQPLYLRVRGAYKATGAALRAALGDREVMDESFVYIDTSGPSNWNHNLVGVPFEFMRTAFIVPPGQRGDVLTLSNPGKSPITFDAIQIETRDRPEPEVWIGLGAGTGNNIPTELSRRWSAIRMSIRTNWLGEPGDPHRFDKMDAQFNQVATLNPHVQPILEGTPSWAAISPERLAEAVAAQRDRTVVPDTEKYQQIVRDIIQRYGDRIQTYEIWNEADISQFWRGTPEEYASFFKAIEPVVRKLAPDAKVMLTGMSGFRPDFLSVMLEEGVLSHVDLFGFHPYAGKAAGWDAPYGLLQGWFFSHAIDTEIYCNESGFPWKNVEWFKPPPVCTPQTQRDALNIAMARLLADGLCKLNVFNAGGDDGPYSLIDQNGKPRAAYAVFADYLQLASPGSRRLDISTTRSDGKPMDGIYTAASVNPDTGPVIIINPADCAALASSADSPSSASPISLHLCLPFKSTQSTATMTVNGKSLNLPVRAHAQAAPAWVEMTVPLTDRAVIRLAP